MLPDNHEMLSIAKQCDRAIQNAVVELILDCGPGSRQRRKHMKRLRAALVRHAVLRVKTVPNDLDRHP